MIHYRAVQRLFYQIKVLSRLLSFSHYLAHIKSPLAVNPVDEKHINLLDSTPLLAIDQQHSINLIN